MKKNGRFFWVSILLLVVAGCQIRANPRKEQMFARLFPSTEMNKQLELQLPKSVFGEGLPGQITLNLINVSSNQVFLPGSVYYQIFFYSDQNGWQEIKNLFTRKGFEVILEPKESGLLKSSTSVFGIPDQKEIEGKDNLRMVVLGYVYENGKATNIQVGAYIDVNLKDYQNRIVK